MEIKLRKDGKTKEEYREGRRIKGKKERRKWNEGKTGSVRKHTGSGVGRMEEDKEKKERKERS